MEEKLLTPLRDVPLPPSGVDLHRAVRDGRRRMRRRRMAAACGVGLAVVGVLAAAPALLARPGSPEPVLPATTPTAPVAPMPDRAPAAFDPKRQYADFGWLPDGPTERTVTTGTTQLALNASTPVKGTGADPAGLMVDLRIVPAGREIAHDMSSDFALPSGRAGSAGLEPADPVNGRTARWNTTPTPEPRAAALRWEYAPDAWAEVIVHGVAEGDDPRALARRIALDVRYGLNSPVRLPVRLGPLPVGLKPVSYRVTMTADGTWGVELSYGAGRRTRYGDWPLVVMVIPRTSASGDNAVLADPDSTLDGHPARRRSSIDGGASLQVYGVQGLYVELTAHDKATLRAFGGNLDGLFRDATLYPKVKDWR
ncbi:hypothetical protein GA0070624_1128 [Micromonospora rhizosphaerae]|uniref:Uncharacterized protein n=1 Tax=Micromonospora rhizosphaerae TaxID=568872 RepID=A0A1C6RI68_9ACTN|nr:hypothetical protein [Micromonospora rhizosphaerae]SCL16805.1 hypothetical protein GA0070624_1128 [Micromonospora rhizosphaerae]